MLEAYSLLSIRTIHPTRGKVINVHEPPGALLALARSQVAALDHAKELREAAEHARLVALTRATWTDHPVDTSASFREVLASVTAVLRAARNTVIARSAHVLHLPTPARLQGSGRRERVNLDTNEPCATC